MKKALDDWRIPLIFAVPVLLLAGVLYLALQPIPGSTATGPNTGTTSDTPAAYISPSLIFPPTTYPTASPLPGAPYVLPCSSGVTRMAATVSVQSGNLVVKVVDQRNKPVVCAWLVPAYVGGANGYGLGGETDGSGLVTYSLAALPKHFHSVSSVQFDNAATAFDYSR